MECLTGESQTRSINDDTLEFHLDPVSKKLVKDKRSSRDKAPEFVVKPRRQFVNEGETAKFKASFDGPPQTKLSWSKNGTLLTADRQHKIHNDKEFHYLEISDVTSKNGGTYTCTIQNSAGSAQAAAELEVYSKPSSKTPKSGMVSPEVDIPLMDAQYSPNDRNVTLECKFSNAVDGTAKWYKDGSIQKSNFLAKQTYDGRLARLVFNKVTEKDGGVYECVVMTSGGEARTKAVITVAAPGSRAIPPKFTTPLSHQTLTEGDKLVLESRLTGYPRPTVKWLKNKDQIRSSTDIKIDFDGSNVKLTMSKVKAADSGSYTCIAENSAGKDQIKANIDVKGVDDFKEPPTFVRELHDFEAEDGDRVELVVEVKGTPPFEIIWVRNDKEISHSDSSYMILAEKNIHKLIIPKFCKTYEGEFSCEAFNEVGEAESYCMLKCKTTDNNFQQMDIQTKTNKIKNVSEMDDDQSIPDFILRPRSIHVEEGNSAIFLCRGSGIPPPSVQWIKQGQIMENKGRYNILTGEDNMLEIKKVTIEDAGRYVCVLSNNAGSISSNVDLVVKKLTSQKEKERSAVCGSGISQGMEKRPDHLKDADKSKVLDIDVTCRVKLDKTKTLAADGRIPSVSVNITSPDGRRKKQELVDKNKLENNTLIMKSSSSVVQSPKSIKETSQPSLKSESASTQRLNPVEISIKKTQYLTEASVDKDSGFRKKSGSPDLRSIPPAKDNQIKIKKSETNTRSTGSVEPQDFRQVVLKKKTVTVNDRTVLANITTKTEKSPKVDYRSVLNSSTKSPLGGQILEKKTTVQQDFRSVLKKTDTGTKTPMTSSLSENKSKFGGLSSNIQGNIKSESFANQNRKNQSGSGILEDSRKSKEQKNLNVTKLNESEIQNSKGDQQFNNLLQTTKGDNFFNSVPNSNTDQNATGEKSFNSVQKVKVDKPLNAVENSKGDKQLDSVQSTKGDKPLISVQTAKRDNLLNSKEDKPLNSVQFSKSEKLLDNTQTPKPVLSKSNQQDFRSVLSHKTNKDSGIKSEREKSPLISKQNDFRSVLKHHVDVDSHQAPKILSHLCDLSVQEGKYVTLECKINGSPVPEIIWSVDGKEIKPSKFFRMSYEDSLARLTISGAYPEDIGKYSCVASNSLGHVQSSCYLHVQELTTSTEHTDEDIPSDTPSNQISEHTDEEIPLDKPSNKISDSSTNEIPQKINIETTTNQISEKQNMISIQSIPAKSISELSESGVDTMKDDISVESDKNLADIKDVIQESQCSTVSQSEDEGFDDYPPDTSSSGQAPQIHDISPARLKTKRGTDVKIQVSYTSDNTTAVVKWFRDTTQINDNEKYLIRTTEHFTSLQILNIQRDESGKYHVVIENMGGSNSAVSNITVEDVPDPPLDKPYASEVNLTSVILTWSAPAQDGGCRVTSFKVEMCKAEDNIWETVSSKCHSTSYQVDDLKPYTPYFFRVSAQNKHGYSNPSQTSDVVVPKERRLSHRLSFDSDDVFTSTPSSSAVSPFSTFSTPEEDIPFSPRNVTLKQDVTFESAYDVKDHLGKGKFGNVYRCVEKISGKTLAAKIIKCRAKEKQKVHRELEIMNKLTHPKLLMLWDAFETARSITLVMECVEGGELFERVVDEDFDLTERDTVYFMRQICDGVSYMHEQGVIHLDLKPENILCVHKDSNVIKIIDFGLARFHHDGESARVMYGTPEFIAPEVVNYEEIGFPTDIWSLGVICYVLLSGLSPFMGDNDAETLSNVTMGEFDFDDEAFDEISDHAKDFISNALQKNMKKRFTIKQCQEHRWLARAERQSAKKLRQSLRNLKHFMARRRWQTMGNAIRALGRMSSLPTQLHNKSKTSGNSLLSDSDTASQSDVSTTPSSTSSVSRLNEDSVSQRQYDNTKMSDYKEIHDDVFFESVQKANSLTSQQNDDGKDRESYKNTNNNLTSARTKDSPSFVKEMVDCRAFTGDVVRFDVAVCGDPQPDVCWYLEGAKINSDSRHKTTNENGECSLIIKQVTVNDEGEYSCRAKNTRGEIKCCAELIIYRTGAV